MPAQILSMPLDQLRMWAVEQALASVVPERYRSEGMILEMADIYVEYVQKGQIPHNAAPPWPPIKPHGMPGGPARKE